MGFSRQEYWSELPFPSPEDLSDSGIEPTSPALAGGFFTTEPSRKPCICVYMCICVCVCVLMTPLLSHVQLFVTQWYITHQAPLVHGIFQARKLEWVAIFFSKGSSWPRDETCTPMSPALAGRFFTTEPLGKSRVCVCDKYNKPQVEW